MCARREESIVGDVTAFDQIAERLEQSTTLDRLESRGTLRIALKEAGFDAKTVRASELRVVVARVLPRELTARGIDKPSAIIDRLLSELDLISETPEMDSPESVFQRLGGG